MDFIKKVYDRVKSSKLIKVQLIVISFSIILGTLLHFTYEWSGENAFVGSFSAVNESVWEHLKLVFFPMLMATIIEYFFVKNEVNNYIEAKTIGIFTAIAFIVVTFFTYSGIIGTSIILIDILIFIISIILGEYVSYKLMKRNDESTVTTEVLSIIILAFLLICFVIFTYLPPEVNLFRDVTNRSLWDRKYIEKSRRCPTFLRLYPKNGKKFKKVCQ